VRLSKFKLESEENFYDLLEIDSGVTDRELKEKYKRLVLKYHPDKNPNCKECEHKFNQILKAWEVLGSPEKRKHYDANSGFVTQIKSQSVTLTPSNYHELVEGSRSLWMIQVYDST
jgi:DnaJ-class molecular chaperone